MSEDKQQKLMELLKLLHAADEKAGELFDPATKARHEFTVGLSKLFGNVSAAMGFLANL